MQPFHPWAKEARMTEERRKPCHHCAGTGVIISRGLKDDMPAITVIPMTDTEKFKIARLAFDVFRARGLSKKYLYTTYRVNSTVCYLIWRAVTGVIAAEVRGEKKSISTSTWHISAHQLVRVAYAAAAEMASGDCLDGLIPRGSRSVYWGREADDEVVRTNQWIKEDRKKERLNEPTYASG